MKGLILSYAVLLYTSPLYAEADETCLLLDSGTVLTAELQEEWDATGVEMKRVQAMLDEAVLEYQAAERLSPGPRRDRRLNAAREQIRAALPPGVNSVPDIVAYSVVYGLVIGVGAFVW